MSDIYRSSITFHLLTITKRVVKNIFSLLCLLLLADVSYAQVYPVQATVQLTPPYSLYLTDYVESGSERLALNIFLSDMARPDLNVRFRLKIIGQGITMETKPGYIPPPVSIQSGVPLRLISTDLADYFNPNNLTFQGMSQRQYEQRGKLPEGVYQFCFEVLEYNRGLKISNTGCATAWLVLNDPPMVNVPGQDTKLKVLSPQNVVLQWTPRHTGSPNSAFTTEYEIKMVEVWPATRNPNDAILTSPPILEETTRNTTFIYGPAETPLEPGRRYAFRIRAKSISGIDELDLFKNNGYSEVFSFVYGDACDLPTGISTESITSARVSLKWEPLFNHTAFKVRYRQAGTTNWYYNNVTLPSAQFTSLKPNTTYEYQVAATCGVFDGAYSSISRVTTAEEPQIDYSCGVPITPFNLDPAELTGSLKPGDVIRAGDFDVKLVSVTGSNGVFTGEGVIEVPYFNKAKVKTSFTSITVNKELRMVNGFMNVTGAGVDIIPQGVMDAMEELSETLDVLDSALTTIEENLPVQTDWTSFVPDSVITMTGEIVDVSKNENGSVTVTDSKGNTQTLPSGTNYAVKDEKGNGYLVDKNGKIHKTTSDVVAKLANREYNLMLKFSEDPLAKNGFDEKKYDALKNEYEQLEGGYSVAWKAVEAGATDPVVANLEGTGVDKSKIRFELGGAVVQSPPMGSGQSTRVIVSGKMEDTFEDLLALYSPSDTSKKDQILGKLRVISYNRMINNLVIVPVNKVTYPNNNLTFLSQELNKIFSQAVVEWKVTLEDPIEVPLDELFDDGENGILSNYTGDMKKVIRAYPGELEENTFYLFLVNKPKSGKTQGYMPRGKQAGFMFMDVLGKDEKKIVNTVAHELCHGAFNLSHIFDVPGITRGSTDNLLDYNNGGSDLLKLQWSRMRAKEIVIGLFEQEEDAQSVTINNIEQIKKFENKNGTYTFISLAGKPITLKGKISMVSFVASEDVWQISKGNLPLGSLVEFTVDDKKYTAAKVASSNDFLGYKTGDNVYYQDKVSYTNQYENVIIGVPCFKAGTFKFRVFPTTYFTEKAQEKSVKEINQGEGKQKEMYFLSAYMNLEPQGIDVFGQFDITFTNEELFFISQQAEGGDICGADALNIYNIAYLIHKKPALTLCMQDAMTDMGFAVQNQLSMQYQQQRSTQIAAVSTAVKKHPLALQEEQRRYAEEYKEKHKEKYLEYLNNAFSAYEAIISSHSFEGLDSKAINSVVSFLAVKNVRGRLCLLRGIPWELRKKLIEKHKEWTFTDNKEELIADLIETVPDKDIPSLHTFLSGPGHKVFWELYNDLHMSEYDRFIFAITMQIKATKVPDQAMESWSTIDSSLPAFSPAPTPDNKTPYLLIGKENEFGNWEVTFFADKESDGTVTVGALSESSVADSRGNKSYKRYFTGNLFDYVAVEFTDDFQFPNVKTGERIRKGQRIIVPAIWVFWLLEKQDDIEDFAVIRIIVNGAAIAISILTMEPGPMLAVELLANSIDIVVAINEDAILSSGTAGEQAFLQAWNGAYAIAGAGLLTKGVIKGIYTFNINSFKNYITAIRNSPQELQKFAVALYQLVVKMGKDIQSFKGGNFLRSLILSAYIEAELLRQTLSLKTSAKLLIAQGNFVVSRIITEAGAKEVSVAKVVTKQNESVITLTEVRWYKSQYGQVDEIVHEVKDILYTSEAGAETRGTLEIVSVKGAQAYVRLKQAIVLTREQQDFLKGLKQLYPNEDEAWKVFNYYESRFSTLQVKSYGSDALIDGRAELLSMLSKHSTRSDLLSDMLTIDAFAFLGKYPNIRASSAAIADVKVILRNKLYADFDEVQRAVNSSNNVQELLEKLALAATRDEFALALKDLKIVDFPTQPLLDFPLNPANVRQESKAFYDEVVASLAAAIKKRANAALSEAEKIAASEQIGVFTAQQKMLEQGFIRLEHQTSLTAKQSQFDGIFWNGNKDAPQVFVIEAKGGSGSLGSRTIQSGENIGKRAQQGTVEYRNDIIAEMQKASDANAIPQSLEAGIEETLELIDRARRNNGLSYLLIRQEIKQDGSMGNLVINKFPN